MSYVIQNFYQLNRSVTITPRFKFTIILNSMNRLLMFFKINIFLFTTNRFYDDYENYFILFYKYFYFFQLTRIFQKIDLSLSANYTNNLKKSIVFYNYYLLDYHLSKQKYITKPISLSDDLIYNYYFLSIKVANYQINKTFYKNIFFYLLLYLTQMWYAHPTYIKYYLNFFFVSYGAQVFKFYNGYFFKIYNF